MRKVDPEMRSGFWSDYPDLPDELEPVWRAFWDLHGSRQLGFGAYGPIPFGEIDRYATRFGISEFEEFHDLIRHMDEIYLGIANASKGQDGGRGSETRARPDRGRTGRNPR